MRADSKQDGIKREHVIFTQACLRSRQKMSTSMWVLLPVKFGVVCVCVCVGGGGGGG